MIRTLLPLMLGAVLAPQLVAQTPVEAGGLEVRPNRIKLYRDGSCSVELILANLGQQTLRATAQAFLVDANGNTIGTAPVIFPYALPGKQSIYIADFHAHMIASPCVRPVTVIVQPEVCELANGGYLATAACRVPGSKTFLAN